MVSPRLSSTTDQLFIQPKCKIAFASLSNGFGVASRRFRAILFREWFRVLYIRYINDLDVASNRLSGISSIDVTDFISNVYFHEPLRSTEHHFKMLLKVNKISYPLGYRNDDEPSNGSLPFFPSSITALELRDLATCSPKDLFVLGIPNYPNLQQLKITCGDRGTWEALRDDPESLGPNKSKGFKGLVEDFIKSLSSLIHLRYLSLDLHLADTSLFPEEHILGPQANQGALALALGLPQTVNQIANAPLFPNLFANAPLQAIQITPIPGAPQVQPPQPPTTNLITECTRNNLCMSCWEVRKPGSLAREIVLAKQLGRCLPHLEVVEYAIWFVTKGEGEQMRRISLKRDQLPENALDERQRIAKDWARVTTVHHAANGSPEAIDDQIVVDSVLDIDITCTITQIPLALYPAILG
ncbi:hypothetical protein FS842_001101 [Serendipita sp. 407]|nr:hypothetical protein FS842_001101 [Serendipita sp. 407]